MALAAKGALTLGEIIFGSGIAAGAAGGVGAGLYFGDESTTSYTPSHPAGHLQSVSYDINQAINRGGSGGYKSGEIRTEHPVLQLDEVGSAIAKMIGSTSSSIIRYRYPTGTTSTISALKDKLKDNPQLIRDVLSIIGKKMSEVTNAADIMSTIRADNAKRQAFLDALKRTQYPGSPIFTLGSGNTGSTTSTAPDSGEPDDPGGNTNAINEVKDAITRTQTTVSEPGPATKEMGQNTSYKDTNQTLTKTKTRGRTKIDTRTEEEKDREPKDPWPPDDPEPPEPEFKPEEKPKEDNITERPVQEIKKIMNTSQQWYPQYSLGGQNILKLTDTERLEELKSYTLFDLVNPLLIGDEDNLLALQNKIQENRRFTNTYPNPRPERPLPPPPNVESWRQPMRSVYPTPYPFSLDMPQSQNYNDHWANQDYQYQAKNIDAIARGSTFDCDLQRVLNNKRDTFTATDKRIMPHSSGARPSLLEDLDSGSITALDLMLFNR